MTEQQCIDWVKGSDSSKLYTGATYQLKAMRTHCVPIPFAQMVKYHTYSNGFDLVLPYTVLTLCCNCRTSMRLRGATFMREDDAPDGLLCADCAHTASLSWWDKHRGDGKKSISWSYVCQNIYFEFSDIRRHVISQRILKVARGSDRSQD